MSRSIVAGLRYGVQIFLPSHVTEEGEWPSADPVPNTPEGVAHNRERLAAAGYSFADHVSSDATPTAEAYIADLERQSASFTEQIRVAKEAGNLRRQIELEDPARVVYNLLTDAKARALAPAPAPAAA